MISQTAEYALRAIFYLAQYDGQAHTNEMIARATGVPAGYLCKVLQALHRAQLVRSQRGLGGGFNLALPPAAISVYQIIQAVDPMRRITVCPLGKQHTGGRLCPLHQRLDDAIELLEATFRRTSVADLLAETGSGDGACDAPNCCCGQGGHGANAAAQRHRAASNGKHGSAQGDSAAKRLQSRGKQA